MGRMFNIILKGYFLIMGNQVNSETAVATFQSVNYILNISDSLPQQYIIRFYASNLFISTNFQFKQYSSCFPCTFLFFNTNQSEHELIDRPIPKQTRIQTSIFGYSEISSVSLYNTQLMAYFVDAICFFATSNEASKYASHHLGVAGSLFPATKIIIYRKTFNTGAKEMGRVICNGYCQEIEVEIKWELTNFNINSVNFHKLWFRK